MVLWRKPLCSKVDHFSIGEIKSNLAQRRYSTEGWGDGGGSGPPRWRQGFYCWRALESAEYVINKRQTYLVGSVGGGGIFGNILYRDCTSLSPGPRANNCRPRPVPLLPCPVLERPSCHQAWNCLLISLSLKKSLDFCLHICIHFAKRPWSCNSIWCKYCQKGIWGCMILGYNPERHKIHTSFTVF